MAEVALAHKIGDAVEAFNMRSDMLEMRCAMIEAWANYLSGAHALGIKKTSARNRCEDYVTGRRVSHSSISSIFQRVQPEESA